MEIVIILGLIGLCTIAYKKITKARRVREQNAALAAADEPAALPQPKETKALPPGLETDIPPASLVRGGMYRSSSLTGHVAASAASIVGNEIAVSFGKHVKVFSENMEGCRYGPVMCEGTPNLRAVILYLQDDYAYAAITKDDHNIYLRNVLKISLEDVAKMKVVSTLPEREAYLESNREQLQLRNERREELRQRRRAKIEEHERRQKQQKEWLKRGEEIRSKAKPAPPGEEGPFIGQKFWLDEVICDPPAIDPDNWLSSGKKVKGIDVYCLYPGGEFIPVMKLVHSDGTELTYGCYDRTLESEQARIAALAKKYGFFYSVGEKLGRDFENKQVEFDHYRILVALRPDQLSALRADMPEATKQRLARQKIKDELWEQEYEQGKLLAEQITIGDDYQRIMQSVDWEKDEK